MRATRPPVGEMLRDWRSRRHLSQLDLALEAGVSARHLSFVETGRSKPSAHLLAGLAEHLEMPLRERNGLLLAAGFAPAFSQHDLADPELGPVRNAIDRLLDAHAPCPALVLDRHWGIVGANAAVAVLTEGAAPHLLEPPVNALRLSLHPEGMAPRIVNLGEWRSHILDALGRRAVVSGDPALSALHDELLAYPGGGGEGAPDPEVAEIATPLRLRHGDGELAFISTATRFGTAVDVTVSELTIESFLPADPATARLLRQEAAAAALAASPPSGG